MDICTWIIEDGATVTCSNCGRQYSLADLQAVSEENDDVPNYCPHCGTKTVYEGEKE